MSTLQAHGINPSRYDVAVITASSGDFSASNGGMHATLIDEATGSIKDILGCMTVATLDLLDLLAVVAALQYHRDHLRAGDKPVRVLIRTENFALAQHGRGETPREDSWIWELFDWFGRHDYQITWEWEAPKQHQTSRRKAQAAHYQAKELSAWAPVSV